jgi:hypothetical protein
MVYIAEEEKLSNWSNFFIMDGNCTVRAATYKIVFIRDDYVTEHTQDLINLPPKEFLILNKTLIKTNLLYVCFGATAPSGTGPPFHEVSR